MSSTPKRLTIRQGTDVRFLRRWATRYARQGGRLVITGRGARARRLIQSLAEQAPDLPLVYSGRGQEWVALVGTGWDRPGAWYTFG